MARGFCIGGPCDGEWSERPGGQFQAAEIKQTPIFDYKEDSTEGLTKTTYYFFPINIAQLGERKVETGFWIEAGKTAAEAFDRLIETYRQSKLKDKSHA